MQNDALKLIERFRESAVVDIFCTQLNFFEMFCATQQASHANHKKDDNRVVDWSSSFLYTTGIETGMLEVAAVMGELMSMSNFPPYRSKELSIKEEIGRLRGGIHERIERILKVGTPLGDNNSGEDDGGDRETQQVVQALARNDLPEAAHHLYSCTAYVSIHKEPPPSTPFTPLLVRKCEAAPSPANPDTEQPVEQRDNYCEICDKTFKNHHGLLTHQGRMHKKLNEIPSTTTNTNFGGESLLSQADIHGDDLIFNLSQKFTEDPFETKQKNEIQRREFDLLQEPEGKGDNYCEICNKTFKNHHGLRIHQGRMHNKSKQEKNAEDEATHSFTRIRRIFDLNLPSSGNLKLKPTASMNVNQVFDQQLKSYTPDYARDWIEVKVESFEVKQSNRSPSLWKVWLVLKVRPWCLKNRPYCLVCDTIFSSTEEWDKHKTSDSHIEEERKIAPKKYCEYCSELIESEASYSKHEQEEHAFVEYPVAVTPTFTKVSKAKQCAYFLALQELFPDVLKSYLEEPHVKDTYTQLMKEVGTLPPLGSTDAKGDAKKGIQGAHFVMGTLSYLEQCELFLQLNFNEELKISWKAAEAPESHMRVKLSCPICEEENQSWAAHVCHVRQKHIEDKNVVYLVPPAFSATVCGNIGETEIGKGVGIGTSIADTFQQALENMIGNLISLSEKQRRGLLKGLQNMWAEFNQLEAPAMNIPSELASFLFNVFFGELPASATVLNTYSPEGRRLKEALVPQCARENDTGIWAVRVALQRHNQELCQEEITGEIGSGKSEEEERMDTMCGKGVLLTIGSGRDMRKQSAYEQALYQAAAINFRDLLVTSQKKLMKEMDELNDNTKGSEKVKRRTQIKLNFTNTLLNSLDGV